MNYEALFQKRYENLNDAQKQAVDAIEGPVLVVAGPGAGKTELLSLRAANILRQTDVLPSSILCLTFTDAAAQNMRERLLGLIGPDAYHVAINTFHSFGREVINEFRPYFYQGAHMDPADEVLQGEILQDLFEALPMKGPLSGFHPEQGFVYMRDVQSRIGDLKKGGLAPEEFRNIVLANRHFLEKAVPLLQGFFEDRMSKKKLEALPGLIAELESIPTMNIPHFAFDTLQVQYCRDLKVIAQGDDTKPLSQWKKDTFKKNKANEFVPKDWDALDKQLVLADLYEQYQAELFRRGYFDFDDMLLDVARTLEEEDDLRYTIQERFLYIMVDEFQDTSGVQMRLLDTLMNMELSDDRPNIMGVGDDDQAIFKFQGASIQNIMQFHKKFREPDFITLIHNYRSTQDILNRSREVIVLGQERLENHIEEVEKTLVASNTSLGEGDILEKEFPTDLHELLWIAEEINKIRTEGKCPLGEVAVLAPKHAVLKDMALVLQSLGIPVTYEKKQNVFDEPRVKELVTMLHFVHSLAQDPTGRGAEELLPEILSYEFWAIDAMSIWKLSRTAYTEKISWLEVMADHENPKLKSAAELFINLASHSHSESGERILDYLFGCKTMVDEDGDQDTDENQSMPVSPFYNFYFGLENFYNNGQLYVTLLSHLRIFVDAVRSHKRREVITLGDMVDFCQLFETNGYELQNNSGLLANPDSVQLMTAYKSKGLEFKHVFMIFCQEKYWMGKGMPMKLPFPKNLPLQPERDTRDDKLRLFYVAMTRAKEHLTMTHHRADTGGKEYAVVPFLQSEPVEEKAVEELLAEKSAGAEKILEHWMLRRPPKLVLETDQKKILAEVLEGYQMSVTHLNTYLDVVHGGPQFFLEYNLLRFPQSKSKFGSYGTAMHAAVQELYMVGAKDGTLPDFSVMDEAYKKALEKERLVEKEFYELLEYGQQHLETYYKNRSDSMDFKDLIERDFRNEGVMIGEASLTGKIDLVHVDKESRQIRVRDFKTGTPLSKWESYMDNEKQKLWKYRNQLIFYKLLVEGARNFQGFHVTEGALEFLEHDAKGNIVSLPMMYTSEDTDRIKSLIEVVHKKIVNAEFPDVSGYEQNLKGIEQFAEDLLDGTI